MPRLLALAGLLVAALVGLWWFGSRSEPPVATPRDAESRDAVVASAMVRPESRGETTARVLADEEDGRFAGELPEGHGVVRVRVFSQGRELRGLPLQIWRRHPDEGSKQRWPVESGKARLVPFGKWGVYADALEPRFAMALEKLGRDAIRLDAEHRRATLIVDLPYPAVVVHLVPEPGPGRAGGEIVGGMTLHRHGDAFTLRWKDDFAPLVFCAPEGRVTIQMGFRGTEPTVEDVELRAAGDDPIEVRVAVR